MRSAIEALRAASDVLSAVSDTPRLDAELLLAHALGIGREALLVAQLEVPPSFYTLLDRRLRYEPIAYILGNRGFWTIELEVGPGVLVPRPDSETLIEAAIAHFGMRSPRRILDLGTGSGALLLAALEHWRRATGLGIDRSTDALAIATRNGARVAPGRAAFTTGDWGTALHERFDLVLCNPPYVEDGAELSPQVRLWEPAAALFGGADGLDPYRSLAPQFGGLLADGGCACVEIGAGQAAAVTALLKREGLFISERRDLAGHVRCLTAAN